MNHRSSQQGLSTLIVLVALLVLALGVLASLRGVMMDTISTRDMALSSKALTLNDAALQQLKHVVDAAVGSGQELEITGSAYPWFTTDTATPDAAFWDKCQAGSGPCTTLDLGVSGFQAWGSVHATGVVDPKGCSNPQYAAVAYALNVLVKNVNKNVQSSSQAIYKVCFPAQ